MESIIFSYSKFVKYENKILGNFLVNYILKTEQRTWREDNIRQVLPPNEAEQVLNVAQCADTEDPPRRCAKMIFHQRWRSLGEVGAL